MPNLRAFMILLMVGLLATPLALLAEDVSVTAELDRQILYEGESFNLNITVPGATRSTRQPALPEMDDFLLMGTTASSKFSFVNGRSTSSKVFTFTLIPQRSGKLEIPAIPVQVKGKNYYTRPISVSVRASNNTNQPTGRPGITNAPVRHPRQQGGEDESGDRDRNVFIRSWVDVEEVYVGQQLTHHFGLFRNPRISFLGTPQYSAPEIQGFWNEPLGDEISAIRKVDGRDYAITELRSALFPSDPGEKTIGSATVSVRLRNRNTWSFFSDAGPERILRTKEITVKVKPLPTQDRPAAFSGLVATKMRLDSRIEPGPYEVGQPITLTIGLAGSGNPRAFVEPEMPRNAAFKYYDPELRSETSIDEDMIRVFKQWTIIVVPKEAGLFTLEGIDYTWFDPVAGKYRNRHTKDYELTIAPSSSVETNPVVFTDLSPERVELLGQDIHHIKTAPLLANDGRRFPRSGAFWISLLLPCPLLIGALIWRRRTDVRLADRAGTRARGARKLADRRLKSAAQARQTGDLDNFCLELTSGLRGYLADRLDCPAAGLTEDSIVTGLAGIGVGETTRRNLIDLLGRIDFARYAPGAEKSSTMDKLFGEATDVVEKLEGEIGAGSKRKGSPFTTLLQLLPCLLLAIGLTAHAQSENSVEIRMAEAARIYETGEFQEAGRIWESLAADGVEDSRLWYNLGNSYYQQRRFGPAILAYRRALRLAPRDQEIRDNLLLARSHCVDGDNAALSGAFERAWDGLRRRISPGELAVSSVALLWIFVALLIVGISRRVGWPSLRLWLILLAVLLPSIWAVTIRAEWQDWGSHEAVLVAPAVNVQSGPGADYITLFEIHEGAELRMHEIRSGWVRVSLGESLEGWIPHSSLMPL
ncbi:MAG: tetratricopeptide repeat protein [bacterium]|nr:tetratricopeptide repeat protein [bacterium]